jgi:YVTN family beta-propeller protein
VRRLRLLLGVPVILLFGCQLGGAGQEQEKGAGTQVHRTRPAQSSRVLPIEAHALGDGRSSVDPAPTSAGLVRLAPPPARVLETCRRLQADVLFPVLCPTLLPYPLLGWPGRATPVVGASQSGLTLDIGYGGPWESEPIKPHLWRNRPCCFLHFVVGARARTGGYSARWVPATAERRVLGGIAGRLLPADGARFQDFYFGNHVRFFFRRKGVEYVATLHTFGNRPTTALLGLLLAHLVPVGELPPARRANVGETFRTGSAGAQSVALGASGIWTANGGDPVHAAELRADSFVQSALVHLDPQTGRVRAKLAVGEQPAAVTVAAGSVWVAASQGNKGIILRVDPHTDHVRAIARAGTWPQQLAADSRYLWVVNGAPFFRTATLTRIDLATGRPRGEPISLGWATAGIAIGAGSVWIADALANTVTRIDRKSGRTLATIRVGRSPYGVAFGAGSVWVTNSDDGTVSRIDPATDDVVVTIRVGRNPFGVAYGRGRIWAANLGDGSVTRLDPRTNRPAGPPIELGGDPLSVAARRNTVCVTSNSDGTVTCVS